jgi:predicted aconitase with swiveling domain
MRCHKAAKGFGQGEALVSKDPILFYSVDPKTGTMKEKHHQLEGSSVAGKVLVFPSGKASSSVQIDGLVKLLLNNAAPSAMIVRDIEATLVASAILTKIPLVDKLEKDPFEVIRTGDFVKVNADRGTVAVRRA